MPVCYARAPCAPAATADRVPAGRPGLRMGTIFLLLPLRLILLFPTAVYWSTQTAPVFSHFTPRRLPPVAVHTRHLPRDAPAPL